MSNFSNNAYVTQNFKLVGACLALWTSNILTYLGGRFVHVDFVLGFYGGGKSIVKLDTRIPPAGCRQLPGRKEVRHCSA